MTADFVPPEPYRKKGDVEDAWARLPRWVKIVALAAVAVVGTLAIFTGLRHR